MNITTASDDQIHEWLKQNWNPQATRPTKIALILKSNMNAVARVVFDPQSSLILKQSFPWVNKYPQIPAPTSRLEQEYAFYQTIQNQSLISSRMPHIHGLYENGTLLVMEDLGLLEDYECLYQEQVTLSHEDLLVLTQYLTALHKIPCEFDKLPHQNNLEMRQLNHTHIFEFPFQNSLAHLSEVLQKSLAKSYQFVMGHTKALQKIKEIGQLYLTPTQNQLLHGDFYPASWVKTPRGVKIIDVEFSFCGHSAFDWGVMLGHLHLSQQSQDNLRLYQDNIPFNEDNELIQNFAGVEILRRLFGVAQLPLNLSKPELKSLVNQALEYLK